MRGTPPAGMWLLSLFLLLIIATALVPSILRAADGAEPTTQRQPLREAWTAAWLANDVEDCFSLSRALLDASKDESERAEALALLARTQVLVDDLSGAEASFEEAIAQAEAARQLEMRDEILLEHLGVILTSKGPASIESLLAEVSARQDTWKSPKFRIKLIAVQAADAFYRKDYGRAIALARSGIELSATDVESKVQMAGLYNLISSAEKNLRLLNDAIESGTNALQLAEQLGHAGLQVRAHISIANALLELEEAERANEHFAKAVVLSDERRLSASLRTSARMTQGAALVRLGRYPEALQVLGETLAICQGSPVARAKLASIYGNRAYLFLYMGAHEEAFVEAGQAVTIAREQGDIGAEFVGLINAGSAAGALADLEQAEKYYRSAAELLRQHGGSYPSWNGMPHTELAGVLAKQGQIEEAWDEARLGMDRNLATNDQYASVESYLTLSALSAVLEQEQWTSSFLDSAWSAAETIDSDRLRIKVQRGYAWSALYRRQHIAAIEALQIAERFSRRFIDMFTWESGYRDSFHAENATYNAAIAQTYLQLGNVEDAFRHAQAAKGTLLQQLLAQAKVLSQDPEVQGRLERYRTNNGELQELRGQLGQSEDAATRAQIHAQIDQLQRQVNADWEFVAAREPQLSEALDARYYTPEELGQFLRPGQVLIDYLVADFDQADTKMRAMPLELLIFVVTSDGALTAHALEPSKEDGSHFLGAPEFDAWVLERVEALYRGDPQASKELEALLLRPIDSQLKAKDSLIISADRNLFMLPFELIGFDEQTLLETHNLQYTSSAAILGLLQHEQAGNKNALVAGITFGAGERWREAQALINTDAESMLPVAGPTLLSVEHVLEDLFSQPLYGVYHSTQEVAHLLGTDPLLDEAATEENLRAQMPNKRVIHLATHGLLTDSPLLNGVIAYVAPTAEPEWQQDSQRDGVLTMAEIMGLPLSGTELTVLQSCHGAEGEITPGAGVMGLTQGFLYAGSRRVIAALRAVPDDAAAQLMVSFYEHWIINGLEPPLALQTAKRELASQGFEPASWAPFVIYGAAD